jgi:hypothetical protein
MYYLVKVTKAKSSRVICLRNVEGERRVNLVEELEDRFGSIEEALDLIAQGFVGFRRQ